MKWNKIVIGGIGGSGTRAVADLFMKMGYFLGSDLNVSNDNLLYTLLFKRIDILVLSKKELQNRLEFFYKCISAPYALSISEKKWLLDLAKNGNIQHSKRWLLNRAKKCIDGKNIIHEKWGWKEPNTHTIIDKFLEYSRDIKFIYVYRNGLDMAFSSNQNQLKFWGGIFLNEHKIEINPKNSLRYWCASHKRMLALQNSYPENVYMLNFDNLCIETEKELGYLSNFLNIIKMEDIERYKNIFIQPTSTNRYKNFSIDQFNQEDLDFLKLALMRS